MKVGVAILAAGKGERVGVPKALLRKGSASLLEHALHTAREASCAPIVVVTGARAEDVESLVPGAEDLSFERNPEPERGQLSSLRIALTALMDRGLDGVLSWPVDHALSSVNSLRNVLEGAARSPDSIIVPTFHDRGGHPTFFPRSLFHELLTMDGEDGARGLLRRIPERIVRIEVDDAAIVSDIDTRADAASANVHHIEDFSNVDLSRAQALGRLFDACGSACFCRYWHFSGDKNDWLARTSGEPEENRRELIERALEGSDEARGVIALDGNDVVGWMKVAPRETLGKLYAQRFYRGLPVLQRDREGVFTVGCALVHPAYRHRGVAHALAGAAVNLARRAGARALEAFPRVASEPITDEEHWMGPASAYLAAGLRPTFEEPPYPVLRIDFAR